MNIEQDQHLFLAGIYGFMLIIRLVYGWQANHQSGKAVRRREPGWSPVLMGILLVLTNSALLVEIFWPQTLSSFAIPLTAGWRWCGLVICIGMDLLFWWVHHVLGKNWAMGVLVKKNHHLVTSGPYRWVRHPMYTTLFGFSIGLYFLSANGLIGVLWAVLTVASAWRFSQEEQILAEAFGSEYEQYAARTGRFLPNFFLRSIRLH